MEDVDLNFINLPYKFKEKGIKDKGDVLTFWGFCNSCDKKIFESIESNNIDYDSYKNQLLYSYRGFLSELYKQEYNIKHYSEIFKSNKLSNNLIESYRRLDVEFRLIVKNGYIIKSYFEKDLTEGTKNFEFIHFTLPRIEVCTSTTYALPVDIYLSEEQVRDLLTRENFPMMFTPIFINLVPKGKNLHVILGCPANKTLKGRIDLQKIQFLNEKEKSKLISDILIKHVETWFVSLKLFDSWQKRGTDKKILEQIRKYYPSGNKYLDVNFNMFDDFY